MNCNDNYLSLTTHLNNMVRHSGNLNGIAIVEVTGHTSNALSCGLDTTHLTFEQLLLKSIGTDPCGKPAIRVKFIATCTYLKNCELAGVSNDFSRMFAYDATAKTFALVINKSV